MAGALAQASQDVPLPMQTVIGVDPRPRLARGGLARHFAIVGSQVFVVKEPLEAAEPIWKYLVQAGFSALPYAPMRPAAIDEESPDGPPGA